MLKYKLTTQDLKTHNGFQWEIGKTITTDGSKDLCSSGWLHYYHHPLLAILLNPIHAAIINPKLWEVKASGLHKDDSGIKGGCTKLSLTKELPIPTITVVQKIAFAILIVKQVHKEEKWNIWADNWLNNTDRSKVAPYADATYGTAKIAAATYDATYDAANIADAAASAAADATYATCAAADATYATCANDTLQLLIKAAEKCLEY